MMLERYLTHHSTALGLAQVHDSLKHSEILEDRCFRAFSIVSHASKPPCFNYLERVRGCGGYVGVITHAANGGVFCSNKPLETEKTQNSIL